MSQTIRIRERLLETDNTTPKKGNVTFLLTKQSTGASGVIVAGASQTFNLVDGWLDCRIIANDQLTPEQAYNVYYNAPGKNGVLMGLYSFTYSTSVQTLSANLVIDVNKNARLKIANYGDVQDAMASAGVAGGTAGAAAATEVLTSGLSPNALPQFDADLGKFVNNSGVADSLPINNGNGTVSWVHKDSIAFAPEGTPIEISPAATLSIAGKLRKGERAKLALASLPTPTSALENAIVEILDDNRNPRVCRKVGAEYKWVDDAGGVVFLSHFANFQAAYDALTNGGKIVLDKDYAISSAETLTLVQGRNLNIDLNGHAINFSHTSGIGLYISATGGAGFRWKLGNGDLNYLGSSSNVTGVKFGDSMIGVVVADVHTQGFHYSGNKAVHLKGVQNAVVRNLTSWESYQALVIENCVNIYFSKVDLNAGQNYTSGNVLDIIDSGNLRFTRLLVQSNKSAAPVRIASINDAVGNISFNGYHFENNGTGNTTDTQILFQADNQDIRKITFRDGIFNPHSPNPGYVLKKTGTHEVVQIEGISNQWSSAGFTAFQTGLSTTIFTQISEDVISGMRPSVGINNVGRPGISLGGNTSSKQYRILSGYSGFFDNYFVIYNETDDRFVALIDQYGDIFVTNGGQLSGNTGTTSGQKWMLDASNGNANFSGILKMNGTPQTLTGAGAVNITTDTTLLVTTGANALTLADGAEGQIKTIVMKTDGGDGTLTPTNARGFATITFNDVGDTATLKFIDGKWNIISTNGVVVA